MLHAFKMCFDLESFKARHHLFPGKLLDPLALGCKLFHLTLGDSRKLFFRKNLRVKDPHRKLQIEFCFFEPEFLDLSNGILSPFFRDRFPALKDRLLDPRIQVGKEPTVSRGGASLDIGLELREELGKRPFIKGLLPAKTRERAFYLTCILKRV
ncbi:MAG: hypothetical protein BWY42_01772 [Candidatus Omnitrophica bacterium ADurb.Bin277]|nr:MAG: hypothetical protein BWY42_01772 [Candidatus Omnitrophica bacterium ADurb.Bin277]